MAALNFSTRPTLDAVNAVMESSQDASVRPYLGMSQIGHPCRRNLWLSFRWAFARHIGASGLKAIEDGHRGEDVMAERLRMVPGVTLHTVDPQTGEQFGLSAFGGHFRGHMDGAILGVLEAPKTWHVWEHKQVNETKFRSLQNAVLKHGEKEALRHWDEIYYAQAVSYMALSGMDRHFLTVATPGGRDFTSVRTEANATETRRLMNKAQAVIFSPEPLESISNDPAWYQCKWCPARELCFGQQVPLVNCRTCAHSTPTKDGQWVCERNHKVLSLDDQRQACQGHRFIPALLSHVAEVVDASEEENWVRYRRRSDGFEFVNGGRPGDLSSAEIVEMFNSKVEDRDEVTV